MKHKREILVTVVFLLFIGIMTTDVVIVGFENLTKNKKEVLGAKENPPKQIPTATITPTPTEIIWPTWTPTPVPSDPATIPSKQVPVVSDQPQMPL